MGHIPILTPGTLWKALVRRHKQSPVVGCDRGLMARLCDMFEDIGSECAELRGCDRPFHLFANGLRDSPRVQVEEADHDHVAALIFAHPRSHQTAELFLTDHADGRFMRQLRIGLTALGAGTEAIPSPSLSLRPVQPRKPFVPLAPPISIARFLMTPPAATMRARLSERAPAPRRWISLSMIQLVPAAA